jgi:hypothetical protein
MATNNTQHDPDAAAKHPLHGLLTDKHGFGYDNTATVANPDGGTAQHHIYTKADHVVAAQANSHDWASTPPNGKHQTGTGADALDNHLQKTKTKTNEGAATMDIVLTVPKRIAAPSGDGMSPRPTPPAITVGWSRETCPRNRCWHGLAHTDLRWQHERTPPPIGKSQYRPAYPFYSVHALPSETRLRW